MEFVVVTCGGRDRKVFIDQSAQGRTGRRLGVAEGFHVFDLGTPVDYTPPVREVRVENTMPDQPLRIPFRPLLAIRAGGPKRPPSSPAARRRKPAPRGPGGGSAKMTTAKKKTKKPKPVKKKTPAKRKKR